MRTNINTTWHYDANGNAVSNSAGVALAYDFDNRLIQVQASGNQVQYAYDGLGDRIRRVVNGATNHHVLDRAAALHNVLMETGTNGVPMRYYVWGANGLIAQIETNGTAYYFHSDELGSTLALTDTNGTIVAQYAYGPNGESWGYTGTVQTAYTFIGGHGVYAEGSGLYHMKARYYSADMKRFLSSDPIGIDGGANFYLYAEANPISFIDPAGLWGANVHDRSDEYGGTYQWALDARLSPSAADIVARADNAVDSGRTGPMPWQDQSRHFNTNPDAASGSQDDSRIQHAEQSLSRAIQLHQRASTLAQGNFINRFRSSFVEKRALRELGTGIHSLQDVAAHADQFVTPRTTLGVSYLQHLDHMDADNPRDIQTGGLNDRFMQTRQATSQYLQRYSSGTAVQRPAK